MGKGRNKKVSGGNNKHHRKCLSNGGSDMSFNISNVSIVKHRAWHTLFANCTPQEICKIINNIWLDTDYEFLCRRKEK